MRRHPMACLRIVLEHWEIRHPDRTKGLRSVYQIARISLRRCHDIFRYRKYTVSAGVFLRQLDAEIARSGVDSNFAFGETALALGVTGVNVRSSIPSHNNEKIAILDLGKLAEFYDCVRK